MFSERLRRATRSLGFRLSFGFALAFTVGAALLFVLIHLTLSALIDHKERDVVQARLMEYSTIYQAGGATRLGEWVRRVEEARRQRVFFVRVLGPAPGREVQLLTLPNGWEASEIPEPPTSPGGKPTWTRLDRDDATDIVAATVTLADGATLQVGRATESLDVLLSGMRTLFLAVLLPVVLVGVIVGGFLLRRGMRPIRQIVQTVRTILDTGRMDARVPVGLRDPDMDRLVDLFNRMLDRNESLVRAMGESLDNAAHDLRTPLARLRMTAEAALSAPEPNLADTRRALEECLGESERVLTMMRALMEVAEAETGAMPLQCEPIELRALMEHTIDLYAAVAAERRILVQLRLRYRGSVPGDPARLRQVVANLLDNALRHTPPGGTVFVEVERWLHPDGPQAAITVRDNGPGIPPQDLPRIWDRLFRGDKTRGASGGLGLGLSLVKAVVEAHRGRVLARNATSGGAEITICLPLEVPAPRPAAEPQPAVA